MIWSHDGLIVTDAQGNILDCDECPCEIPYNCTTCAEGTKGSAMQITFFDDSNVGGGGAGCTGLGCDDWTAAWELPLVTLQEEMDKVAAYLSPWTSVGSGNCWYLLDQGLACGATALVWYVDADFFRALGGGSLAFGYLYVVFPAGMVSIYARIDYPSEPWSESHDCRRWFQAAGGVSLCIVNQSGTVPCDFAALAAHPAWLRLSLLA